MHKLFLDSLLAHMKGVMAHFEATRGIDHRYQKGFAREALVKTAIEPWFGPSVSIGSGFVINSYTNLDDQRGGTSSECDNVIFWPDLMPNLILGGTDGPSLFPIEGVASVVEVKSKLTTTELRNALESLPTSTRLKMLSGLPSSSPLGQRTSQSRSSVTNLISSWSGFLACLAALTLASNLWVTVARIVLAGGSSIAS